MGQMMCSLTSLSCFGFGQPGAGPPGNAAGDEQDANNEQEQAQQENQPMAEGWGLWPNQEANDPVMVNGPVMAVNVNEDNLVNVPVVNVLPANAAVPGELFVELNDFLHENAIGIDLNQDAEDDLGGIEDLIQETDNLEANGPFVAPQEDIIDEWIFVEDVPMQGNFQA